MSTGEILLALGALILLSINSLNVNRTYVASVKDSVEIQYETEAIQFGHYIVELMYNYSTTEHKSAFLNRYGDCEELDNTCVLLEKTTFIGNTLKATIEIEPSALAENLAVITVYEQKYNSSEFKQRLQFQTALTFIDLSGD